MELVDRHQEVADRLLQVVHRVLEMDLSDPQMIAVEKVLEMDSVDT